MPYLDTIIGCRDCKQDFVFTAEDQAQRAQQGLLSDPEYCVDCQERARTSRTFGRPRGGGRSAMSGSGAPRERVMHPVICSVCGVETTVPFVPTEGKPVSCSSCFQRQRESGEATLA